MKRSWMVFFVSLLFSFVANAAVNTIPSSDVTHAELRQLKDSAITAINAGNYDLVLPMLHQNIVVTAENNEVVRHHEGIAQFYKKLLLAPGHNLKSFKIESFEVDELSMLYGNNTAIAFGSGVFDYQFNDGKEFKLPCRWTAVLIKENNKWLLAAFHNSVNVEDNPVLQMVRTRMTWIAAAMLVVGVILGFLVGKRYKGKN